MARVIKPPEQREIVCPKCDAKIGYSKVDIEESISGYGASKYFIECPNESCGAKITVDSWHKKSD